MAERISRLTVSISTERVWDEMVRPNFFEALRLIRVTTIIGVRLATSRTVKNFHLSFIRYPGCCRRDAVAKKVCAAAMSRRPHRRQ